MRTRGQRPVLPSSWISVSHVARPGLLDAAGIGGRRRSAENRLQTGIFPGGEHPRRHGQSRWAQHEKDERRAVREELLVEQTGSKAERIREILDRGEHLPAVRLSADYIDLKEAERAESLAIDTINAAPGSPNSTSAPAPQTATCSTWTQQYTALTRTGSTCENACQSALSASSPNFDRPRSSAPSTISDLVNVRGQRTSDPLRAPEAHAGNAQSHGMLDHSFQGHAVAWHDR